LILGRFTHAWLLRATVLVTVSAGLTACSAQAVETTCADGVAAVAPAKALEGMGYVVSSDLAASLRNCATGEAWMKALQANPQVVDAASVSDDDAKEFLIGACGLASNEGSRPRICDGLVL
jgi:hypothetical protein